MGHYIQSKSWQNLMLVQSRTPVKFWPNWCAHWSDIKKQKENVMAALDAATKEECSGNEKIIMRKKNR